MREAGERLEGRCHSPVVRNSVGREGWCKVHLRSLKVGKIVRLLERERVLEDGCLHLI